MPPSPNPTPVVVSLDCNHLRLQNRRTSLAFLEAGWILPSLVGASNATESIAAHKSLIDAQSVRETVLVGVAAAAIGRGRVAGRHRRVGVSIDRVTCLLRLCHQYEGDQ